MGWWPFRRRRVLIDLRPTCGCWRAGELAVCVRGNWRDPTGISKTHILRQRVRLIRRLSKRGQTLAGCDLDGRRVRLVDPAGAILPSQRAALCEQLLAGTPVRRAARSVGIGACPAYRIRNELAAELATRGEVLPKPIRLGSRAETILAREAAWLPMDKRHVVRFRVLCREYGDVEGKRLMQVELAAEAAAARAEAKRPLTFEEQLRRVSAGKAQVVAKVRVTRAAPDMTLGGVATGAL